MIMGVCFMVLFFSSLNAEKNFFHARAYCKHGPSLEETIHSIQRNLSEDHREEGLSMLITSYPEHLQWINQWIEEEADALLNAHPEYRDRIALEKDRTALELPHESEAVCLEDVPVDAVKNSWAEQMQVNFAAMLKILRGDPEKVQRHKWMWWEDRKKPSFRLICAVQTRNSWTEACKLARMLSGDLIKIRIVPGETLFSDDFSKGLSQWKCYGNGKMTHSNGEMKLEGRELMAWTSGKPFPENTMIELTFRPHTGPGGVLFSFPGTPRVGLDYSHSATKKRHQHVPFDNNGIMERLNWGIWSYHTSVHRAGTGRTNLRRTGHGLKMLSCLHDDPCEESGKKYRLRILTYEGHYQFFVNGRLIHSYLDAGVYGPPPTSGQLGIRIFPGGRDDTAVFIDTVTVCRLKKAE